MAQVDEHIRLVRVVAVSPGDVTAERDALEAIIGEINRESAGSNRCFLQLWRWETAARPGLHVNGPQGLIDDQMDIVNADIVIGVFWKRFGTPTCDAQSGTEHELRRAWAAWKQNKRPDVMVYFCERPHDPTESELEQWASVKRFRSEMLEEQFWCPYREVIDFERLVREHLRSAIQSLDRPSRVLTPPGMAALIGRVRLRVVESEATFSLGDPNPKVFEVDAPGATIGRGEDADVRLVGKATNQVGRRHLLLVATGRQWTVADCASKNGTFEEDRTSGSWRRLPTDVAVPVNDGMLLSLGSELFLRLELEAPPPLGGVTPRANNGSMPRVRPADLEELAIALLEHRRADNHDQSVPTTDDLAAKLLLSPPTIASRLRDLRKLEPIRTLVKGARLDQLADALETIFPYLLHSRSSRR